MRHHSNPDEALRSLVRAMRETGSPDATVQLAEVMIRRGLVPAGAERHDFYSRSSHTASNVLPSFLASPWGEARPGPWLPGVATAAPDACLVPINPHLIYVQVGQDPDRDWGRDWHEASFSWDVTEAAPDVPGIRPAQPGHYHGQQPTQSVKVKYRMCADLRPVVYQKSPHSKVWTSSGSFSFRIFPESGRVQSLTGWHSGRLGFHGGRQPANYAQVLNQQRAALLPRLTRFVADWAAEHPDAFNVGQLEIDTTKVARALKDVEFQAGRVRAETKALYERQAELRDLIEAILPRLGL
jgi:hypothetical protein